MIRNRNVADNTIQNHNMRRNYYYQVQLLSKNFEMPDPFSRIFSDT